MRGTILRVNISRGGVPKLPVARGFLAPLGIEGDAVAHPAIHGGPNQAVLLIASEVVDELSAQGWPVYYGALGENLTTQGIDHKRLRQGQQYRAGEAIIELTKPRGPCATLDVYGPGIQKVIYDPAVKARDPRSPVWGMSGFYASVVQPGAISPGDPIVLLSEVA